MGSSLEEEKMTIGDWAYFIFSIAVIGFFIWSITMFIQESKLPQEVKDNEEFAENKAVAVKHANQYCLRTKASECKVCIKRTQRVCQVYITLKGKEIEQFVNSQQLS